MSIRFAFSSNLVYNRAMSIQPTQQDGVAVDATTAALIAEAQEQGRRGQVVTLEQAEANLRKQIAAWHQMQAAQPSA